MAPIGSFSGLASGIQWRDMIDQIMRLEASRRLDPLTSRATLQQKRVDAWGSYRGLVSGVGDAARKLRESTGFGVFGVSVGDSPSSGRTLFTATASATAAPGSHRVEVLELARAEKLSGAAVSDPAAALGISGDFVVNGKRVTVAAADSLNAVRDKVNAVNGGTTPSGVTATILSTHGSDHRLVLTADHSGSGGIDLTEGSGGVLRQLGVVDGTLAANTASDGSARTQRFSSTTETIATMLGVTLPPPSTIKVGGKTISVDLSVDSLSAIAARIEAAGVSAETVSETVGGATTHRLKVGGSVVADSAATDPAASQRTLELLGFVQGGRSAVAQSAATGNTLTDAVGATATTATLLTELGSGGSAGGVQAGDTFAIRGTRADGTAVDLTYTVQAGDTVQGLLDRLNDATDGFGAGSRPATATLDGGKIRLTDREGGDSQLSFSITAGNEGGGTLDFGATTTDVVGRQREVVDGTDARFRLDGVLLTRQGNTVSDALSGVTLNLQQAEAGTEVDLTITRDLDAVVESVKGLAAAYNKVLAFVEQQRTPGAPLSANGTLRTTMASLTRVLLSDVAGLESSPYPRAGLVGVALSRTGTLEVDEARLKEALTQSFNDVRALFNRGGTATDGEVAYAGATEKTLPGTYAVEITAAATRATHTGAGFGGSYADDGTADTMTVSDAFTGKSTTVQLADGDTLDAVVARLNDGFRAQGMRLTASGSGGQLAIEGSEHGSAAAFTVSYAAGGTDSTAQLGFAAGTYAGADVQGTIGGLAATGQGQVLTGAAGGATEGLAVRYTGSGARSAGSVTYTLGVAGMMAQAADAVARADDGTIAGQVESLDRSIESLNRRAEDVEAQLEVRRETLTQQFIRMEQALSRVHAQGSWLASQIQALQPRA